MPVGYTRVSQIHALLAALQYLLAPIICIALLLGAHQLISMGTGDEEVALGIIAGLLFYMFLRGQMSGDSGVFASGWMIVSRVVIAWVAVVGVLLLIGYAAKISHEFSRRALFIWFLTTPALVSGVLIVFRQWLRSKMVKSAFGVAGGDLRIGAEILCRASLGADFAHAGGQYFDNDTGQFAAPHDDALDAQKCAAVVRVIEEIAARVAR